MDKNELIVQIEQAFADAVYPGDDKLINANHCGECAEIAEVFRGKKWSSLTNIKFLRRYVAALSLLYPEAFRYYLPAYMIAALIDPATADVILDSLEYDFMPRATENAAAQEWFFNRATGFSPAQKRAIKAYLEFPVPMIP
jgi:hypothetical protein